MVRLLAAATVLGGAATSTPAAPVPAEVRRPLYYPNRVGAGGVYRLGEREVRVVVSEVTTRGDAFEVTAEQVDDAGKRRMWERVVVSRDGLSVLADGPFRHDPPLRWLVAPNRAGDRWAADTSYDTGGGGTPFYFVGKVVVVGEEEVQVPAGTYRAVRVRARMAGWREGTEERWYAPGVGLVKQEDKRVGSLVLKELRPAR